MVRIDLEQSLYIFYQEFYSFASRDAVPIQDFPLFSSSHSSNRSLSTLVLTGNLFNTMALASSSEIVTEKACFSTTCAALIENIYLNKSCSRLILQCNKKIRKGQ